MLLSTSYLPNIQYIDKFRQGEPVIEAFENFQKQTFRNRCTIMTANGVLNLTVPVIWNHHEKMPIREVKVDNSTAWQRTHWRAITAAYKSSPYFEHYADWLEPFFNRQFEYLWDLNCELLVAILAKFKLSANLLFTEQYVEVVDNDFRNSISPKISKMQPDTTFIAPVYYQVFAERYPFVENLSIIDYLFCNGSKL